MTRALATIGFALVLLVQYAASANGNNAQVTPWTKGGSILCAEGYHVEFHRRHAGWERCVAD